MKACFVVLLASVLISNFAFADYGGSGARKTCRRLGDAGEPGLRLECLNKITGHQFDQNGLDVCNQLITSPQIGEIGHCLDVIQDKDISPILKKVCGGLTTEGKDVARLTPNCLANGALPHDDSADVSQINPGADALDTCNRLIKTSGLQIPTCVSTVKGRYFSASALSVCNQAFKTNAKFVMGCLSAAAGRDYVSSEAEVCRETAKSKDPSDCLKKAGVPYSAIAPATPSNSTGSDSGQ